MVAKGSAVKHIQQRLLLSGCFIVVLFAILVEVIPLSDASDRLMAIPDHGSEFTTRAIPLSPHDEALLGEANAVKWIVHPAQGGPFVLSAIDGTRNRQAVHDPRYCFEGAGWRLVSQTKRETERGTVMVLEIERNGVTRQALFWFTDGKSRFASPMRYWMAATLRRLTFGAAGEEPILYFVQGLTERDDDEGDLIELIDPFDAWKS